MEQSYDVIVVGAGSAGCPLAARLSEDPQRSVLLLDAGPRFVGADQYPPELRYGGDLSAMMPGRPYNWNMIATLREGKQQPLPRGRVVGGSSAVNGTLFTRGLPEDFDSWAAAGNPEWSYEKVLPFFRRLETDHDMDGAHHGRAGPVPVRRAGASELAPIDHAFMEAARAQGHAADPDMNAPGSIGVGLLPVNNLRGIRMNTALAYLDPAGDRSNLHVQAEATVSRIVFDGSKAIGVELISQGKRSTVFAGEVVLSAGAIKSPQLLMCSGVGPGEELRRHGIPLVQDLPQVGRGFTDHGTIGLPFTIQRRRSPAPHPTQSAWAHAALHYTTPGSSEYSDMMLIQTAIPMSTAIFYRTSLMDKAKMVTDTLRKMSLTQLIEQARQASTHGITIVMMCSDARGEIRLTSADSSEIPDLQYHYLESETDRRRLREALRLSAAMVASEPYRKLGAQRTILSDAELESDAVLDHHIHQRIGTSIHMAGSCQMSPSIDTGVVDQYCRVHGVDNLRVVDSSIMPTVVRRCPAATAIMIGERAAAFFN